GDVGGGDAEQRRIGHGDGDVAATEQSEESHECAGLERDEIDDAAEDMAAAPVRAANSENGYAVTALERRRGGAGGRGRDDTDFATGARERFGEIGEQLSGRDLVGKVEAVDEDDARHQSGRRPWRSSWALAALRNS